MVHPGPALSAAVTVPPIRVNKFFYQRQTDSGAACGAGKRVIHAVKVVENFF